MATPCRGPPTLALRDAWLPLGGPRRAETRALRLVAIAQALLRSRALRLNPTVLLVLSAASVKSDWVAWEVKKARELEAMVKGLRLGWGGGWGRGRGDDSGLDYMPLPDNLTKDPTLYHSIGDIVIYHSKSSFS